MHHVWRSLCRQDDVSSSFSSSRRTMTTMASDTLVRAMIPSNSLAAVYSIAADAQSAKFSGRTLRSPSRRLTRRIRALTCPNCSSGFAVTQFWAACTRWRPVEPISARPRYRSPVRAAGIPSQSADFTCPAVCRCLTAAPSGSMHAGHGRFDVCREAEGRLELVLQDASAGRLAPLYDFIRDLPAARSSYSTQVSARHIAWEGTHRRAFQGPAGP